jgi:hypothetical protein
MVRLLDAADNAAPKKLLLCGEITYKLHKRISFVSSVIQNDEVIPDVDVECV